MFGNKRTQTLGMYASLATRASEQDPESPETETPETGSTETEPPGSESGASGSDGGDDGDDRGESVPALPLDQVFEILKNKRRRETLHYLMANGGEASLSDLAEHIAAIENDTTVRAISSSQRKRVYVGLYQCHLPKMDDMNIVDFDQNRGTIALAENVEQLEPYLRDGDSRGWYKLYLGIAVAGTALLAVGLAGGAAYGLTPAVILLVVLTGTTACAAAQAGVHEAIFSGTD